MPSIRARRVVFLHSRHVFSAGYASEPSGSVRRGSDLRERPDTSPDASSGTGKASGKCPRVCPAQRPCWLIRSWGYFVVVRRVASVLAPLGFMIARRSVLPCPRP